jgi:uncharacterized membrane protein
MGKTYMALMFVTALIILFMPAQLGPQLLFHFGRIYSFSFLTLYTVPTAYIAIIKGQVKNTREK